MASNITSTPSLQKVFNQSDTIDVAGGDPFSVSSSVTTTVGVVDVSTANLGASDVALHVHGGGTSFNNASYGLQVTMEKATATGAAAYFVYAGVQGEYSAGSVVEITTGNMDAGQFILDDSGSTGRNIALSRGGLGFIGINAPTAVVDYNLTLPLDDGDAGQLITSNGTGTLDFSGPVIVTGTPTAAATCTADCAGSGLATGGGCTHSAALAVQVNQPSDANTWTCTYLAYVAGDCTATVICTQ
jgi:hypothetical protein